MGRSGFAGVGGNKGGVGAAAAGMTASGIIFACGTAVRWTDAARWAADTRRWWLVIITAAAEYFRAGGCDGWLSGHFGRRIPLLTQTPIKRFIESDLASGDDLTRLWVIN